MIIVLGGWWYDEVRRKQKKKKKKSLPRRSETGMVSKGKFSRKKNPAPPTDSSEVFGNRARRGKKKH